jgi:hypothetical protein
MKNLKKLFKLVMFFAFGALTVFSLYKGKTDYAILSLILFLDSANDLKQEECQK